MDWAPFREAGNEIDLTYAKFPDNRFRPLYNGEGFKKQVEFHWGGCVSLEDCDEVVQKNCSGMALCLGMTGDRARKVLGKYWADLYTLF